jgi:hypothetical protein
MSSLADVIRSLRPEETPTQDTAVMRLRCPHTDQPLLDVTWFRGKCSRCNQPVQVPKRSFDQLAARRMVAIVCFECFASEEPHPCPMTS